jgi:energy-coupling factor transporter ATP-binding protein EcfA2
MNIEKANTIDEIYNAVLARPLSIDEMDKFYCETDDVRGGLSARFQLSILIKRHANSGRNAHLLFVGYRGCGKSTELNHLQKDMQNEFMILNYSVMKELDPQSINYIELFIVTMQRLFDLCLKKELQIENSFINQVVSWTETKEINEIKEKHFSGEIEAGINSKFGIPYLQEFFIKLKGAAKASKSFKETIKNTLEPRLSDLIYYCNELISAVRIELVNQGFKDLIIFIEDLDKIPLDKAQMLFFNYANQLTQLNATVIYTFPVTLYYNTNFGAIRSYFSDTIELPMVKIFHKNGDEFIEGINVMKQIVYARVNKVLFVSELLLEQMIKKTGGVIRDLFAMINDSANTALFQGKAFIDEVCYTYAYNQLKKEYNNTIADYVDEKGAIKYKASQYYEVMAHLVNNNEKKPENSELMMHLRQNLCILTYNGEGWCDVHPIMKDILREKGYLH